MSSKGAGDDALLGSSTAAGTEWAVQQQQPGRLSDAVVVDGIPNDRRGDGGAVGGGNGKPRQNIEASVTRANFDTPGGVDRSLPSGMPTNCYDPLGDESVRMLDARIRALQARRSEIARRSAATSKNFDHAKSSDQYQDMNFQSQPPPQIRGANLQNSSQSNIGMSYQPGQVYGQTTGMSTGNMTHQAPANNNVLSHIAGAKADSFAQAFVDRFAAGLKNTKRRGADSNDSAMIAAGEKSSTKPSNSDDEGSDGASGEASQWFVCKFCENKAYRSRVELKQHAATCDKNPNRSSSQRPPKDVDTQCLRTSSLQPLQQDAGGGIDGIAAPASIQLHSKPSVGDQTLPGGTQQQGNEMLEGFRKGISYYQEQMRIMTNAVNQSLPGTQQGGFPQADMRMNEMLEDYRKGINFYNEQMLNLTNQAMGQCVPVHTSLPGVLDPVKPSQHRKAKPVAHSNEVMEESKGPFRKLGAPILLSLEEDKDWLTPLHCFVRKNNIEAFTATQADVDLPCKGKRKAINLGQVGIRCPHCHKADSDPARLRGGSVYYPNSLSSLYNAAMNLLQRHLHSCPNLSSDLRREYENLKNDDARSGTSKKYWVESAMSLGFVDTTKGIMISTKDPPPVPGRRSSVADSETSQQMTDDERQAASAVEAPPLVIGSDRAYSTKFTYLLISNMQPCVFTEADRLGKRRGLPKGFAGLACRHCFGGYGSGRFFPSSIKTLSDTSKTLSVIFSHMSRCRRVPPEILKEIKIAMETHDDERQAMKFGSQKRFFEKIWSRLHDNRPDGMVLKAPPTVKQPPKKKPPPTPMQPVMPPNNYGMVPSYASLMYQQSMPQTNAMAQPLDPRLLIPKGGVTPNVLAQVKEQIRLREQMMRGQMQQQVVNPRDGQFVGGHQKPAEQMLEAMRRESQVRQSEDVNMGKRPHSASDLSQGASASKRARSEEPSASY